VPVRPRPAAPNGYLAAFEVEVPLLDMPRYLGYLEGRLQDAGTSIEIRAVRSLDDAAAVAWAVINCTGLGARELVPDASVRPVRGQHVVVENPGLEEFFMEDPFAAEWTSWFPHAEHVILGGIAQPDATDPQSDPDISAGILARCATLEPRLRDAPVVEHQVGLRPARDSVRVEEQPLGRARCVHNYGHGGSGVGLSWGCAREVEAILTR
jgi:D-amino-acid oxidase